MTEEKEENDLAKELNKKLKDQRDELFTSPDLDVIEAKYEEAQRELFFSRAMLNVVQEAALNLAKRKIDNVEELHLFQGSMMRSAELVLEKIGASPDEIRLMLFGEAKEESYEVKYTRACVDFARAAEATNKVVDDLAQARTADNIMSNLLEVLASAKDSEEDPIKDLN